MKRASCLRAHPSADASSPRAPVRARPQADWKKLRVKELRKICEDEGINSKGFTEKDEFLKGLDGVALASDAFFPFRDSLDVASTRGVKYVVAAGGSVADAEVIAAADEYKMVMAFSGLRLFHH